MDNNLTLNERERKFCEEFFKTGKRAQSAIAAGYSEKSAGVYAARLLKKEKCLKYIRRLQSDLFNQLNIDTNWAVLRAVDIYNRCMQSEAVTVWDKSEGRYIETGEYTFDSKGALKALELINKILRLSETKSESETCAVTIIDDLGVKK